jgi:hypothetical protein
MLQYSTQQSHAVPVALTPGDDQKLRRAFGRFAESAAQPDGVAVVSFLYAKNFRRLHCDCCPEANQAPLLFLVSGTHIHRQMDGKGTPHDENCVFARDQEEQKTLINSYRLPKSEDAFQLNLLRNFSTPKSRQADDEIHVTTNGPRSTLARTLCLLLEHAKLDRFYAKDHVHGNLVEQKKLLEQAAINFTLDTNHNLFRWLATSLQDFHKLKRFLVQNTDGWERPHVIFIETFNRIEDKILYPTKAGFRPIPITGRLSVFGEGKTFQRPPYLVIGVLGQASRAASFELLDVYVHPCIAWDRLTLVDSALERDTLKLLMKCRDWLTKHCGIDVTIKKPLFDVGQPETEDARELCLPDFILSCKGEGVLHSSVVIKTMGYNTPAYRHRKQRMRHLFERVGRGPYPVPVIEHDRFLSEMTDKEADRHFCQCVCKTIAGRDP